MTSELEKLQQQVRELEKYRLVTNATGVGLWQRDLNSGQTWYSVGCKTMLGYDAMAPGEEFRDFSRLAHPDDLARYEETLIERSPYDVEFRMQAKDGNWRWIREIAVLEEQSHLVGSRIDISHNKKEAGYYLDLMNKLPSLIFLKNAELKFSFVNQALADVFGDDAEDIIGKTDGDYIKDTNQVEQFRRDDLSVLREWKSRTISEEWVTDWRDNTKAYTTEKVPFWGPDGKKYVLGISTDVSHDQMRVALASDLIHAIRSPIAQLATHVTSLEREVRRFDDHSIFKLGKYLVGKFRTGTARKHLEFMRNALEAMDTSSSDLAVIAHGSDPDGEEALVTNINLIVLISERIDNLKKLVGSDVILNFNHSRGTEDLSVRLSARNQQRVRMAIGNVLDNAVKFSHYPRKLTKGRVEVEVLRDTKHAILRIKDNGVGISSEDLPKVWKMGFTRRAHNHPVGTGMGLAIVRRTFNELGWPHQLQSEIGIGTTFEVRVPLETM